MLSMRCLFLSSGGSPQRKGLSRTGKNLLSLLDQGQIHIIKIIITCDWINQTKFEAHSQVHIFQPGFQSTALDQRFQNQTQALQSKLEHV